MIFLISILLKLLENEVVVRIYIVFNYDSN
jgi:hypothetical protein